MLENKSCIPCQRGGPTIDIEEAKIKASKKHIKSVEKVKYVKRDAVKKIIAAWVITVPAAAVLAAVIFFMIRGIVL